MLRILDLAEHSSQTERLSCKLQQRLGRVGAGITVPVKPDITLSRPWEMIQCRAVHLEVLRILDLAQDRPQTRRLGRKLQQRLGRVGAREQSGPQLCHQGMELWLLPGERSRV